MRPLFLSWQILLVTSPYQDPAIPSLVVVEIIFRYPCLFLLLCCCSLQIVDLALLVKKDSERGDVLSSTMPVVSAVSQNQVSGLPNLTLPTSTASTPNHTPPGTPTTPTTSTAFMSSPSTSTASASAGSIAGVVQGKAAKGKKRKAKVPNETI